jgi:predicted DNA-binding transcriptional regulator
MGLLIVPLFGLQAWVTSTFGGLDFLLNDPDLLVRIPILLGVVLIMVIAMWIGYTMLTTPAPEPLEDFDFDEEEVTEKKEE